MVKRVLDQGRSSEVVAKEFAVSTRTVGKWIARYKSEGVSGLENRSSRPKTMLYEETCWWRAAAMRLRKEYRLTAQEIATKLNLARSTVAG